MGRLPSASGLCNQGHECDPLLRQDPSSPVAVAFLKTVVVRFGFILRQLPESLIAPLQSP